MAVKTERENWLLGKRLHARCWYNISVEGGESAVRSASPQSGEVSPVSQMSPYNMSPLSVSPIGSTGVSPIAGNSVLGPGAPGMTSVLAKIHSRRFREYVTRTLSD